MSFYLSFVTIYLRIQIIIHYNQNYGKQRKGIEVAQVSNVEVTLVGQIAYTREAPSRDPRWPPRVYSDVVVPAADGSPYPTTFQVTSSKILGERGSVVNIRCKLVSKQFRRTVQTANGPRDMPDLRLSLLAIEE
ncbi:hypothetical protein [Caulobacter sp. DWR1-3-2b1]|uniref:hypothetical protein n=1 Tax=Caulobacter sp. DWR1-3-2b1 TaxID=2804670 RepID=UPI003CE83FAB